MPLQRLCRWSVTAAIVAALAYSNSLSADDDAADEPGDYYTAQAEADAPEPVVVEAPPTPDDPKLDPPAIPLVGDKDFGEPACDCGCGCVGGCGIGKPFNKKAAAAYKGVFYDNDFSYLCDPCYDEWHLGERFKRRCIGDNLIIDAGGEYRLRFQNENNLAGVPLSSSRPAGVRNDDFWLHRTRLYLNAEYGGWLRGYAEAIDATSEGQRHPRRFIEINRFDALNLFAEAKLFGPCGPELWVRGGRQELLYGGQRLISPLDWSNTRRTFDGVKAYYKGDTWDLDGFWMRPVPLAQHGAYDTNFDSSASQEEFIGLYGKYKGRPGTDVDFYFLRLANYSGLLVGEDSLPGDADPNTCGMRLKGDCNGLLWAFEGGYQFGEFANDNIQAGFWTVGFGKKFTNVCWKPNVWLYYDWASGDEDPTDGTHGTFNQYFPLAHKYLGFMDIVGRQNIQDLNLFMSLSPHEQVKLILWYHMFWLESSTDALYNAGGAPIYRDPTGASGNEVGNELDFLVQWTVTPRINLWFGYSHFFTGDYFQSATIQGPGAFGGSNGSDADFFYTQATVRF